MNQNLVNIQTQNKNNSLSIATTAAAAVAVNPIVDQHVFERFTVSSPTQCNVCESEILKSSKYTRFSF